MKPSKKPLEFVMTAAFANHYPLFDHKIVYLWSKFWSPEPIDMYIFEPIEDGWIQLKVNGYNLDTEEYIETKNIGKIQAQANKTFWLKIDDYGDKLIGTFLFPEDY